MIAASDANLAAATDSTIIIPGHGKPVSNKSELKEFRDMLVDIRESVAEFKKAGRTQRDETVAAKPTAAHDAKWGQFVIDPGLFHQACLRRCVNKAVASAAIDIASALKWPQLREEVT